MSLSGRLSFPLSGKLSHCLSCREESHGGGFAPIDIPSMLMVNESDAEVYGAGAVVPEYGAGVTTWGNQVTTDEAASDHAQTISTHQPEYYPHNGTNYLLLTGQTGGYVSVPHSVELDIIGDVELIAEITPADFDGTQSLITNRGSSNGSVQLRFATTSLNFLWYQSGTPTVIGSTLPVPFSAGDRFFVKASFDVDNGAAGNTTVFSTSTDGATWTQLGTPVVTAGVASIDTKTEDYQFGAQNNGALNPFNGAFHSVAIVDGIDGTTVLDIDFSKPAHGATEFVADSGQAVTVHGDYAKIIGYPVIRFDGVDDYLVGTFPNDLTAGRWWMVVDVISGDTNGRLFGVNNEFLTEDDHAVTGFVFARRDTVTDDLLAGNITDTFKDDGSFGGRMLIEVLVDGANGGAMWINGREAAQSTADFTSVSADTFRMAMDSDATAFTSIDVEAVYLDDGTASDSDVTKVRRYIENKYKVGSNYDPSLYGASILVEWTDASSDEDGFRVELSTNGFSTIAKTVFAPANTESLIVYGLLFNQRYFARCYAYNDAGDTEQVTTSPITTVPDVPVNLELAEQPAENEYLASWEVPVGPNSSVSYYVIEERNVTLGGDWVTHGTVSGLFGVIDGLEAATEYQFRVTGSNVNDDTGLPSNVVTVTTEGDTPPYMLDADGNPILDADGNPIPAISGQDPPYMLDADGNPILDADENPIPAI